MTLTSCARHPIRTRSELLQQRVDEAADEQRVLEVVDLFEQRGRGAPRPSLACGPRARYQTFHSSNDSHSRLVERCRPCT
jgi:hypothetical protein